MSIEIDVRGLSCPIPVMRVKKAIDEQPGNSIEVLVDSDTAKQNIVRLAASRKYKTSVTETSSEYRLRLEPPKSMS